MVRTLCRCSDGNQLEVERFLRQDTINGIFFLADKPYYGSHAPSFQIFNESLPTRELTATNSFFLDSLIFSVTPQTGQVQEQPPFVRIESIDSLGSLGLEKTDWSPSCRLLQQITSTGAIAESSIAPRVATLDDVGFLHRFLGSFDWLMAISSDDRTPRQEIKSGEETRLSLEENGQVVEHGNGATSYASTYTFLLADRGSVITSFWSLLRRR